MYNFNTVEARSVFAFQSSAFVKFFIKFFFLTHILILNLLQAREYLQHPEEIGKLVDPELENVKADDLAVICSVVSLCIEPDPSKRPSMQIIASVLENGINLSPAALLKDSPLAWAELALSS